MPRQRGFLHWRNTMDRKAFYAALRKRDSGPFGTSLTQSQVEGCEAILDECIVMGATLQQTAYILGTGCGETGGRMQAVRENLNYSEAQVAKHFGPHRRQGKTPAQLARNPVLLGNTVYGGEWGREHLGNVKYGDGFDFRGFWIGQFTGRRNAEKAGRDLGLDLVGNPALLDKPDLGHRLLVRWMLAGRATGVSLRKHVNKTRCDYLGAREVWGGVDAQKYVALARAFEAALTVAGYHPAKSQPAAPAARPTPVPASPTSSPIAALIAALLRLFRRT